MLKQKKVWDGTIWWKEEGKYTTFCTSSSQLFAKPVSCANTQNTAPHLKMKPDLWKRKCLYTLLHICIRSSSYLVKRKSYEAFHTFIAKTVDRWSKWRTIPRKKGMNLLLVCVIYNEASVFARFSATHRIKFRLTRYLSMLKSFKYGGKDMNHATNIIWI